MHILTHRGNLSPADIPYENSVRSVRTALEEGFGVEIDIRWANTGLYVSHDPNDRPAGTLLEEYLPFMEEHRDALMAFNVKDVHCIRPLIERLANTSLENYLLFDFGLIEVPAPAESWAAARVSDYPNEHLEKGHYLGRRWIWLDEMDREWVSVKAIETLAERCKVVWVSPDLHSRPHRERWLQMLGSPLTAICTDYALELRTICEMRGVIS